MLCIGVEERLLSGQRQRTVNPPAYAFVGSNPTLSTNYLIPWMIINMLDDVGMHLSVVFWCVRRLTHICPWC